MDEQFKPIGTSSTLPESKPEFEEIDPDDNKRVILFGTKTANTYKARFFDEEGFEILERTVKRLEIKPAVTKFGIPVRKNDAPEPTAQPPPAAPTRSQEMQNVLIPMKLDLTKPPPPISPISTKYEWWLQKGASMFPDLVKLEIPKTTSGTVAPNRQSVAVTIPISAAAAAQTSEAKAQSAPSVGGKTIGWATWGRTTTVEPK